MSRRSTIADCIEIAIGTMVACGVGVASFNSLKEAFGVDKKSTPKVVVDIEEEEIDEE